MSPQALLERLAALGVTVRLTGDAEHPVHLAPADRIPVELRPEVAAHKEELAALVDGHSLFWQADPSAMPCHTSPGEDPRPDLPGTELWAGLLQLAAGDAADPRGVYGRLLGARACGAVLEWRTGRWKLAPTMDPAERVSTWATPADWERDAERWLRPKSREIVALLGQLPPRDEGAQG